jgi:hypothetical protein
MRDAIVLDDLFARGLGIGRIVMLGWRPTVRVGALLHHEMSTLHNHDDCSVQIHVVRDFVGAHAQLLVYQSLAEVA